MARNVIWWQSLAGSHDAYTARSIWTCAVFATSSFNFGLPTYYVSHYCYGRALYAVFSMVNIFFLKSRAELLIVVWQMTCQRSHVRWCALCWHDCIASTVSFGSFKNLILSGFARDWCRFPSKRLPYTSICLSNFFPRLMFTFIPLFVDFVRYLTFWHPTIQI